MSAAQRQRLSARVIWSQRDPSSECVEGNGRQRGDPVLCRAIRVMTNICA
jgi:hypothetical protein